MVELYYQEAILMALLKRTYALPADTLEKFEQEVRSGERSAFIAGLIREWLEERERAALRDEIIAGLREMEDVILDTQREWDPLSEEVWRRLDD
jgi:hypothetical protein